MMINSSPIIEVKGVSTYLGGAWVNQNLDLTVKRGEILGLMGGSGSGKTTLLREILMLRRPNKGSIKVFGEELMTASPDTLLQIQRRWGVLFQQNALFSSLTVLENAAFPLHEHTTLDPESIQNLALLKILFAGLPIEASRKYPAELSGGMQKRAALARAIVLDPELIFLDEPTTGLDPRNAAALDELVLNLRDTMGLSIVIITHDLDTLWTVTDRVAFLGEGRVLCIDTISALVKNDHPMIRDFFMGPRGEAARRIHL